MTTHKNIVEFVRYVLQQICEHKDQIEVVETEDDRGALITISVADSDMGRVIGREGQMISSIRLLARSMASKDGSKIHLKIAEEAA